MSHVFISYKSSDRDFALDLAGNLVKNGFDVWLDQWRITGRDAYWKEIQEGIENCSHFIFVISPESISNDSGVMKELYHAAQMRPQKVIVPVIARVTVYNTIPMLISPGMLQIHDFTKLDRKDALARVIRALRSDVPSMTIALQQHDSANAANQHHRRIDDIPGGWATIVAAIITGVCGIAGVCIPILNTNQQAHQTQEVIAIQETTTVIASYTKIPTVTLTPSPYPTLDQTRSPTTWQIITRTFDYNGYSVEMVLVPAGSFTMGDDHSDQEDERPAHSQQIDQPFWLDLYEITNDQFDRLGFVTDNKSNWTDPQRPREGITWEEAKAFCEQKRSGFLPTEAQWEWAARGPQSLQYPWGNEWDPDKVVWNRSSSDGTANVGSKPSGKSWVGVLDMGGNVWEWTSSLYRPYPYKADDGRENQDNRSEGRVLRGGAWDGAFKVGPRSANRIGGLPDEETLRIGFRCARSL